MKLGLASVMLTGLLASAGCSAGGGDGNGGGAPLPSDLGSGNGTGGSGPGTGGGPGVVLTEPEPVDLDCDSTIPVVYRDFDESHPDFEMQFAGDVVRHLLIEPTLDAGSKPVFRDTAGCPGDPAAPTACLDWGSSGLNPVMTSQETFDQWYRDVEGVNQRFEKEIELVETGAGTGIYVFDSGSAGFFPLSASEGWGITPANHDMQRNFLFTTEVHLSFTYVARQVFTFRGDDDLWIFVNGRLALDLGSMHVPTEGTIDFDAQAADLGISPGVAYSMDIFHAERHTRDSNFRIETNIACFVPVVIR